MDKEKKEKKKKINKKEAENDKVKGEKSEEKILQKTPLIHADECQKEDQVRTAIFVSKYENIMQEENWKEMQDILKKKGKNKPEGFYIVHPKNIKQTVQFKDVHSRKLSELSEAFHMFDFDRDGIINHDDLKKTFASLCIEVREEEINQMLSEGLNPLNFDAFVILLGHKTLDLDPEEVLLDALSNWDDHQEGLISYEKLMQHILTSSDKFTEEEAVAALADAPIVLNKTKEKMIDYIQFSEDLCGLRKMMQRKTNEGNSIA